MYVDAQRMIAVWWWWGGGFGPGGGATSRQAPTAFDTTTPWKSLALLTVWNNNMIPPGQQGVGDGRGGKGRGEEWASRRKSVQSLILNNHPA